MNRRIEAAAEKLRSRHGYGGGRVDVEDILRREGIDLRYQTFPDDTISSILYRTAHEAAIVLNASHLLNRQRFSIGHELGHYELHEGDVYLDGRVRMNFRDDQAGKGTDREEIEANAFAAALLMPEDCLRKEFEQLSANEVSEQAVAEKLAESFEVSVAAMTYRLVNIALISSPDGD